VNRRREFVPLIVGALVVATALPGFFATRDAQTDRSRATAQARASAAADVRQARRDANARLLVATAEATDGNPNEPDEELNGTLLRLAPARQLMGVIRTTSASRAPVAVAVPPADAATIVGVDLAHQRSLQLMFELARDSGDAKSGSGTIARRRVSVLAEPLYGSQATPLDVAARRNSLVGYVVLVTPTAAAAFNAPSTSGRSAHPLTALAFGLALAVLVTVIVSRRERRGTHSELEARARADELALIARMGPMLQQSLTLSELLPLFVVEVSNEFHFSAASISLASESGELTRVFAIGAHHPEAEPDVDALGTDRGPIAPGGFVHVALERGGRTIGVLRARTNGGMTTRQVDSFVAVCTLLSAALGNAQLFENEKRMVAQLRDVDAMKIAFVGSVSHELRTSATAIEGFAGLLDNDRLAPDDPRRADYIQRIRRNARSLGLLVEDLLDFARMERAGAGPALKRIDMSKVVPEVVDQLSPILSERPVAVQVMPGLAVIGDLSMVERILANLLSNAAKYTPANSAIDVTLGIDGNDAVLTVADHGPGIPADERENVFRLFYRVDDESMRATRGIGIGLALVKQLVDQMNGDVRIDETPGGGATFRVAVPLMAELALDEQAQPACANQN
jgi:signal transduction histidine kinase